MSSDVVYNLRKILKSSEPSLGGTALPRISGLLEVGKLALSATYSSFYVAKNLLPLSAAVLKVEPSIRIPCSHVWLTYFII